MVENTNIAPGAITEPKLSKNLRLKLTNVEKGADGQIPVVQSDGSMAYKTVGGDATLDSSGNFTVTTSTSSTGETTQGATGATGAAGATGATGAQGATGAAGSDATVTAENVDGALGFTGSTAGLVQRTADNTFSLDTSTYSTTGHTHDDRYYTETEADTLLAAKSGTGHTHDDRYYTETETDTLLATKSGTSHTHDSRYYTETETDTLLATKSGTSHTHDDRYYTETESDTLLATKSGTSHTHDDRYYTETEADTLLATKAASSHTHGDIYYTETEADTLLATKAASSHSHTLTDVTDSGTAAPLNVPATGDAASGEVVKGSDTRLIDTRTPSSTLAHKSTHETGESDALSPSDIGAAASSHAHDVMASGNSYAVGFVPIGSATHSNTYLRKDGTWETPVDTNTTYASSDFDHDALTNFVANEHLDWTADQGATNIHTGNYTNTTYASSDFDHDALTNFVANEHIDWTSDQGATNLHTGNYTNTTYSSSDFDHDALTNFETNEHIDWTADSAGTVHASNYTNTTYSAGNSGLVPAAGSAGQFLKHDASWGTPPDTTANESITLSGDVSGTGTTAITCTVGDDSHSHSTSTLTGLGGAAEKDVGTGSGDVAQGDHTHDSRYFQESEFLNASAGAGDAGKPVKLDAGGHIDTTMINDGDISYVDLDDIPSTFAPSSHNHAASEITSGTLADARIAASSVTQHHSSIDHDALNNFVTNEHIDWTASSAGTVHSTNYTNTTYSVMASGNSYAAGLVAAGSATHSNSFLRKDGTWVVPTGTATYTADDGIALSVGNAFSVAAGTGLTQDASGLSLNLQGVAEAAIRVDDDYIVFLDGGSTGAAKKESIVDLATAMAGTGLTANAGELRASNSMGKYIRWITWGTTQTDITYNGDDSIATINHGLGSQYVTVALIDVDGVATEGGANSLNDIDFICIVKCIDTNNITIEWNMTFVASSDSVPANNDFKLTVIG